MSDLRQHTGTFTYFDKDIQFHYWSNTEGDTPPDTVIFLGTGQVGKIAYWVAKSAGSGVVVVGGVPHWEADPGTWNVVKFCQGYVDSAFTAILKDFGLKSLHLIAESQAAPAAISLAKTTPDKIRSLVLIRPLGFTSVAFGDTEIDRLKEFKRRLMRSHLQFPQTFFHDPRNLLIDITSFRALMKEKDKKLLNQKYAEGVSYDVALDCQAAAKVLHRLGRPFTMLLGEKDRLFPPKEITDTLTRAKVDNVKIVVMPNATHGTLANRAGKPVVRLALKIARTDTTHKP